MATVTHLFSKLNQADLLPVQQNLVSKLTKVPFTRSKEQPTNLYYELLETLFKREYP